MLFCFFCSVNDFSTTRGPIHAKVCTRAYSGSGCLLPFWGLASPGGGKRGQWHFRYYGSQWGIIEFWWFLSDISATRARIHTKFYLYRDNVCLRAPSGCGVQRPLGAGRGGVKNSKRGMVVSCVHRTATISVFLSTSKCGSICRAQTCAHSGV